MDDRTRPNKCTASNTVVRDFGPVRGPYVTGPKFWSGPWSGDLVRIFRNGPTRNVRVRPVQSVFFKNRYFRTGPIRDLLHWSVDITISVIDPMDRVHNLSKIVIFGPF